MRIVAFLLTGDGSSDDSFMKMIRGAQSYCASKGYSLLVECCNDNIDIERQFIDKAISDRLAGLIIFSVNPDENLKEFIKLKEKDIPFVLIDRAPESMPFNVVCSYNLDGTYQSTNHLINLGHKKIIFAGYAFMLKTVQDRLSGYKLALEVNDIAYNEELVIQSAKENPAIVENLIQDKKVTAIVCSNDFLALFLVDYLTKKGIKIPEDVSVVGFDGVKSGEYMTPMLTTVTQPFLDIGKTAAEIVIDQLEGMTNGCKQVYLPTELCIRESVDEPNNRV